ncbi:hypothetical protein JCM30237_24070 [Halolamina litorea]
MGSVLRIAKNDFTNVRRSRLLWGVVGAYAAFTVLLVVSQATTAITSATELLVGVTGITAVVLPAVALVAGYLAGRDIGRVDVHLGRRPRAEMLGSEGGEGGVGTLDLVGGSVVGVRDVPLDAIHHPRDDRLGELEWRRNRRPSLVDRGVDGWRLDVGIVDGQLLVHPFGQDEGDVVPASESANSLVAAVRGLSHRDEQAGVGDVEPAHASSAASPSSISNSSSPAPVSSMS